MENSAFAKLETRVQELVELCQKLQKENAALRVMTRDLSRKQITATTKVNQVLNQLKMIEEA